MVQQAQLDYKETFTWGTWWKQFWCQEVVTTSCQHSMNTDSMVATIGKWAIWGNFKVMVYTVREDQHWVIFNSWAGGGTEWEIWFFSMWNFTREVLMTKDSWKKTEGNLSPHYSSPRNVPLPRRTRVASSWTGGQPLISVSSPVAATPPRRQNICVSSALSSVLLSSRSTAQDFALSAHPASHVFPCGTICFPWQMSRCVVVRTRDYKWCFEQHCCSSPLCSKAD